MIVPTFRRTAKPGRFAPLRNEQYRTALGIIEADSLLRGHEGDIVIGVTGITVLGGMTVIRAANDQAQKTLVRNQGAGVAKIYEDGHLVRILQPGDTQALPLNGMHEISALAIADTQIRITTYLRPCCENDGPAPIVPRVVTITLNNSISGVIDREVGAPPAVYFPTVIPNPFDTDAIVHITGGADDAIMVDGVEESGVTSYTWGDTTFPPDTADIFASNYLGSHGVDYTFKIPLGHTMLMKAVNNFSPNCFWTITVTLTEVIVT